MGLKLNGATSGSVELGVPAAIGSDINYTLPGADGSSGQVLTTNGSGTFSFANEGKVLQALGSDTFNRAHNTLNIAAATSLNASALYGTGIPNRLYADVETITITPKSATSMLVLSATVGFFGYNPRSDKGCHGIIFVENDTTGYEFSDYPGYDPTYFRSIYPPPMSISKSLSSNNTATRTFDLKAFSYNESSGSAANTIKIRGSSFTIMEIEQ